MKLTCFGKYGPYPKGGMATSCYMLTHGGKNVVIEMGCGALSKLLEQINIADIHAVALSHLHADHMGDMLTLRYALAAAKRMGHIDKPIPVYLPDFPTKEASMLTANAMMDATIIRSGMQCDIFGMKALFAKMPHPVPSFAMSFEADGKKFVYSGDTQDNEKLAPFAKKADLLLMDAAILAASKIQNAPHLSAVDAGRIGRDADAKRMLITHLFPEYDPAEVLAEAQQHYPDAEWIEENKQYEV